MTSRWIIRKDKNGCSPRRKTPSCPRSTNSKPPERDTFNVPKKSSKKSASSASSASSAKYVEPKPTVTGLDDSTGWLKHDGHQCYYFGEEKLIPVKTLKEAKGRTVWYRQSNFDNLKPIEIPK